MHIRRHLAYKLGEVDRLTRDGECVAFQFAEVAQLRYQRADTAAGPLGLFEHLPLFVCDGAGLFLQNHAQVAGNDRHGRAQLVDGQRHRARELVISHAVSGWSVVRRSRQSITLPGNPKLVRRRRRRKVEGICP
jgi:hypothetical protein